VSKVTFICDEAASLGANMSCIDDAIDKGRGYGISLILVYQSLGQLKICFPRDGGQTLRSNVTEVFFGTSDYDTAEEGISRRIGDHTVVVQSGGRGWGRSSQKAGMGKPSHSTLSTNANENWGITGRRLLKPEEVMGLDERTAITFVPGVPPIISKLQRYYEGRVGSPRFQGIKAVIGTLLTLALGTGCAMFATLFVRSLTQ
jgi:type IV secretion system protein VirD4